MNRKKLFLLSCTFLLVITTFSQPGISIAVSLLKTNGEFSETHLAGIGVEYAPALHNFGLKSKTRIAFTYNGGLAYYIGKKETTGGYDYKYPSYLFIHAFAGALFVPVKKTEIKLTAGPALGIYNGNSRFTIGSQLEASYYINRDWAIGPKLILMKETGADPLWTAGFKLMKRF